MNLIYYSKILVSLLLVSSLTMHAIKIEEIKSEPQNQTQINNKKTNQQMPTKEVIIKSLKSKAKIVGGAALLLSTGFFHCIIIKYYGFKTFLSLPLLALQNAPEEAWKIFGIYGCTGLGAYLLQSGIREAYEIKKNQKIEKQNLGIS